MRIISIIASIFVSVGASAFEAIELGTIELSSNQAYFTHAGVARANFASPSNNLYTLDLEGLNTLKFTLVKSSDGTAILERDFDELLISDAKHFEDMDLLMIVGLDRSSLGGSRSMIQFLDVSENDVLKRISISDLKSYYISEQQGILYIDKGLGKIEIFKLDDFSKTTVNYSNDLRPVFSDEGINYLKEGGGHREFDLLDADLDKIFSFESATLQFLNPDQKVAVTLINKNQILVHENGTNGVFSFYDSEANDFILPDSEIFTVSQTMTDSEIVFTKGREVKYWDANSKAMTENALTEDFVFNFTHGLSSKTMVYWSFPESGLVHFNIETGSKEVTPWSCSTQNYFSKTENMVLCTDDNTVRWVQLKN